ncbi:MAG TPA: class I SAM-dependent methyltransferase [Thermoanaerobaculia bacterium]|nr:class I SAM-dependent methyltransferase [Thermoanaerobaculia bacterium]
MVRAFLGDRGIEPGSLDLAIDARDEMLGFLVAGLEGDRERALLAYFHSGLSIADGLLQVLRWRFGDLSRIGKVLDFASGYGRITRFLVRPPGGIPADRLAVADVYAEGVRFQQERFGVQGVVSTVDPEDFSLSEKFDAVLVTSLFTHLPAERFRAWLRVLLGLLNPGGVLAFSTHDPGLLVPRPELSESGLLFQEISESGSLATSDYGSTWVTEDFVRGAVAQAAPAASVFRLERGLCNYQDLYIAVLEPGVDFSSLGFQAEPELFVEHCALASADRLEMRGWAVARAGTAEAVEVVLSGVDGQILASFPIGHSRPDVAELFGSRFLRSGWGGACPLPAGLPRSSVLLIRIRDGHGNSYLLQGGSLESMLLESTRNDVSVLHRELKRSEDRLAEHRAWAQSRIEGLRARIAAMEASRFWKMRNAWFQLKRALGLTDEK